LNFDGASARGLSAQRHPLEARREALMRLVGKRRADGILFNEALAEEGAVVFAKVCERWRGFADHSQGSLLFTAHLLRRQRLQGSRA
jgi:hypothetical protein